MINLSSTRNEYGQRLANYALMLLLAAIVVVAIPLGLGTTIFVLETAPHLLTPLAELLGSLPSVVLGFLGILVLSPFLRVFLDLLQVPQFVSTGLRKVMASLANAAPRKNYINQEFAVATSLS